MKLLLLNPNTSVAVTERMLVVAREAAQPGTEIVGATAPRGMPYIATRAEAVIGGAVALEMLAEAQDGIDGAIIAAFGDPGLDAARELMDMPVVGLAEAAMLTACMVGRRFAIISFSTALGAWYRDCVEMHGLSARLAGIRLLDGSFASITDVQEEKAALLLALAQRAVREDAADCVVLAGAPLAGLAERIAAHLPVPVIDGVAAAVKQVETLVSLRLCRPGQRGARRPPKTSIGLPPALARLLADVC